MAQSRNNIITHGLSGKVGDLIVFSQRGSKTIVSQMPKGRTADASEKQKEQKLKFQQAVLYAKAAIVDPATKDLYSAAADKEKGISSYNIAVADLLQAPEIEKIDLSGYTGKKGDLIRISATDDFKVASVKVIIRNGDGSLLEEGMAKPEGTTWWVYKSTETNSNLLGDKIIIQATDLPDNLTERVQQF